MNYEQNAFLKILKDYLNKEETVFDNDIDWNQIYKYSAEQNLTSIIYVQCKNIIPDQYKARFLSQYSSSIVLSRNRNNIFNSIKNEFDDNEIKFFIVKGSEIANLYHHPDLRTMGDTDIILSKDDLNKANKILIDKLSFNKTEDFNEWVYFKNNFEFELHHSLVYDEDNANFIEGQEYLNDYWAHTYVDENNNYHLDWNFHLIYLLFHLRKHIINEGIGFRQFLDIAFVCKKINLDWNNIIEVLGSINLLSFSKNVFTLLNRWFDIKTPLVKDSFDEEFYNEIINKIYKDGVFGHINEDNKVVQYTSISNEKDNKLFTKVKYIFRLIFPSIKALKSFPYLSWIKDRNYLIPIAWLYRLFYILFNKNKMQYLNQMLDISDEDIENRKSFINKWEM